MTTKSGQSKRCYKGFEEFHQKDPEVPKLSKDKKTKLELCCITNISKIRSEYIETVIIGILNIKSLFSKFDDLKILIS